MHESSKNLMKQFVDKYLKDFKCGAVLDVGSYDVNGTYKDLFDERFKYTGLDIESGLMLISFCLPLMIGAEYRLCLMLWYPGRHSSIFLFGG